MASGNPRFDSLLAQTLDLGVAYEFWPAADAHSKKLLIVLHGRGDSPEGLHFLPGVLDIDALNVLFLRAPAPYSTGYSWYALPPDQAAGIIASRGLILHLLETVQTKVGLSSTDVFLLGFSQGCLMVLDTALRYPKHLGGVVGISGYVFFESEYPAALSPVAREQKIWISHGLNDDVLPFETTRASVARLRQMGLSIDWNPVEKGHSIDEADEIPHIKLFLQRQLDAN